MIKRILILASILVFTMFVSGCIRSACDKALPVLSQGRGIVGDAALSLEQASDYLRVLDAPADVKAKIQDAIAGARTGLRAGSILIDGASEACNAPDLPEAFKAFVDSWNAMAVLLHQATAGKPGAVGSGALPFETPLIVKLSASRR